MFKKMRDRPKKTVLLTNLDPQSSTSTGRTHKPLSAKKAKDSTFNFDDTATFVVCSENIQSVFKNKKYLVCKCT